MLVLYHSRQFAMSHGSYDLNLGSEILVLVGDIVPISVGHTVILTSEAMEAVRGQKH